MSVIEMRWSFSPREQDAHHPRTRHKSKGLMWLECRVFIKVK